jgi:ankyrin repeat protein
MPKYVCACTVNLCHACRVDLARDGLLPELQEYVASGGADIGSTSAVGDTALHWAAYRGSLQAAQVLLEAGADPDAAGECGNTPLHLAATGKHFRVRQQRLACDCTAAAAGDCTAHATKYTHTHMGDSTQAAHNAIRASSWE